MKATVSEKDVPGRTIYNGSVFNGTVFDPERRPTRLGQEYRPGIEIVLTQVDTITKRMSDDAIAKQAQFAAREVTRALTSRRAYLNREESTDE